MNTCLSPVDETLAHGDGLRLLTILSAISRTVFVGSGTRQGALNFHKGWVTAVGEQ